MSSDSDSDFMDENVRKIMQIKKRKKIQGKRKLSRSLSSTQISSQRPSKRPSKPLAPPQSSQPQSPPQPSQPPSPPQPSQPPSPPQSSKLSDQLSNETQAESLQLLSDFPPVRSPLDQRDEISDLEDFPEDSLENESDEFLYFNSYAEFNKAKIEHEIKTYSSYILYKNRVSNNAGKLESETNLVSYLSLVDNVDKVTISWSCDGTTKGDPTPIKFCGKPFILLNSRCFECHQGTDHNKKTNDKRYSGETMKKRRNLNQPSKKTNCPAKFTVKRVIYFPQYSINQDTKFRRAKASNQLKEDLKSMKSALNPDLSIVETEVVYITKFPSREDHCNHHIGEAAGIIEKTDPRVVEYIKKIAREGVRNKKDILFRVKTFVKDSLCFDNDIRLRNRFLPSRKKIRNILAAIKASTRFSKFDQENVMELKKKWERSGSVKFIPKGANVNIENIIDHIDQMTDTMENDWESIDDINISLPSETSSKLCFVYQSRNMQRLYRRYGPRLVLLDATYKVCKYSLPLYFLVVQTNVSYQVAAVIVVEDESQDILFRALSIVKDWNPDVHPKYAMADFDVSEITVLESLFPGIRVFLCDFHREQAWNRWVNKKNNGVYHIADDVKCRLRRIANSVTVEEANESIQSLMSWENFTGPLMKYFKNTWQPEIQRWCLAYRPSDLFRCNTNNGTERLNEALKYDELGRDYVNCSLSELMTVLIESFLPNLYANYVKLNVKYTSGAKPWKSSISRHYWNRPGPLVDHFLSKEKELTPRMIGSVDRINDACTDSPQFYVQSSSTTTKYKVDFGNEERCCSCECRSFKRIRLPCKHFFAVIKAGMAEFNDLSSIFLNDVYSSIDEYVTGPLSNAIEVSQSVEIETDIDTTALRTPLPQHHSQKKNMKDSLISNAKVVTEKLWNLKSLQSMMKVKAKMDELLHVLNEAESIENEGGIPLHHENFYNEPVDNSIPPRRYEADRDIAIYDDLPSTSRKHPYSGRVGYYADLKRKQNKKSEMGSTKTVLAAKDSNFAENDIQSQVDFNVNTNQISEEPFEF